MALYTPQNPVVDFGHPIIQLSGAELVVIADSNVTRTFDHIRRQRANLNGVPRPNRSAYFGTGVQFDGTDDALEFPNRRTVVRNVTIASTFHVKSTESNATESRRLAGTSSATNTGIHLEPRANVGGQPGAISITLGGAANVDSGLDWDFDVPYFAAVSWQYSTATIRYVLRNLFTGKITRDTQTTGATNADGDGIFNWGGSRVFNTNMFIGRSNMALIGNRFMTMEAMLKWAESPFGFVKPSRRPLLGKAVAGAVGGGSTGIMTSVGYWGQV